jgi:hypothetical protein
MRVKVEAVESGLNVFLYRTIESNGHCKVTLYFITVLLQ